MFHLLVLVVSSVVLAEGLQSDTLRPIGTSEHEFPQYSRFRQRVRSHASKSVLILGCSVDRYAVEWFCGQYENFLQVACTDTSRDLAMGFVFHPGVGYNGNMHPPFYNRTRYGNITSSIIGRGEEALFEHATRMVGVDYPDMVVVDTSLWDLANWASTDAKDDPSPKRLGQWCHYDLPNLLWAVQMSYSKSRVVFRTAPVTGKSHRVEGIEQFSPTAIEYMHDCVRNNTQPNGKLWGQFTVIDYHEIMDDLMPKSDTGERTGRMNESMWLPDGYHPNKEPARRYMNEILRLMDMPTVEEKDWAQTNTVPAEVLRMESTPKSSMQGTSDDSVDGTKDRVTYNI